MDNENKRGVKTSTKKKKFRLKNLKSKVIISKAYYNLQILKISVFFFVR